MKNLLILLIILACGSSEGFCFAYPALTEQDRRSIAASSLTEGQKRLAEYFVSFARQEGQRLGINPALGFAQSPTGIDDREYRLGRLEALREKREAHKFQIEQLQESGSLKEPLPRAEAVPLIAKQIGVSPEKTQILLAKREPKSKEEKTPKDNKDKNKTRGKQAQEETTSNADSVSVDLPGTKRRVLNSPLLRGLNSTGNDYVESKSIVVEEVPEPDITTIEEEGWKPHGRNIPVLVPEPERLTK